MCEEVKRVEDSAIIGLYNARDESALGETEAKYGAYCRSIALNLLCAREDAEECVNDALHTLWRRIPPDAPKSLRAYLGRVVRNLAVSRHREKSAKKRGGNLELLLSELDECVPDGFDVEAEVERRALGESISRWLDGLPEADRRLFVRRCWYGESVAALAGETGRDPRYVSQRLSRLRARLKAQLQSEGEIL